MTDQPEITVTSTTNIMHLGARMFREIGVDAEGNVWWRLNNRAHDLFTEWFKGDPR